MKQESKRESLYGRSSHELSLQAKNVAELHRLLRARRREERDGLKIPAKIDSLREIERGWTAPMANSINTRVRYATWDAMRLAAAIASGPERRRILAVLRRDKELVGDGD